MKTHFCLIALIAINQGLTANEMGKTWTSIYETWSSIYETLNHREQYGFESISGPGSNLIQTNRIRHDIPLLINTLQIKTMLDVPCGDFFWMKEIIKSLNLDHYFGIEIVQNLVNLNTQNYATDTTKFMCRDLTKDQLPMVDLILCRDCLVHFSDEYVFKALKNFKASNSRYLLTTTFTNQQRNYNIPFLGWRPINLQLPPFNFPAPLVIINEGCTESNGQWADKSLALWELDKITLP